MPCRTRSTARAETLLHENTYALFGPRSAERHVFIMVTAPDAAQVTPKWATEVIRAGADVLRINGAHESPPEWSAIAATFKAQAAEQGKRGCIFVDLPGPKLRTEIRTLEDAVIHLPRRKDRLGRTVAPTEVLLVGEHRGGCCGRSRWPASRNDMFACDARSVANKGSSPPRRNAGRPAFDQAAVIWHDRCGGSAHGN